MKLNIGLKEHEHEQSAQKLKTILADQMVLYVKTLNFHWNVKGENFGPLHQFFQQHYEQYANFLDEIAERIQILGHAAPGSMGQLLKLATLKEHEAQTPSAKEMLKILLQDQQHYISLLREAVDYTMDECHDAGTSDFLTSLLASIEKIAWMTRSHLES